MNWGNIYTTLRKSSKKYPFYNGDFKYSLPEKSKIARRLPPSRVGWGRRAVEMRANKTHFDRFENDTIGLNDIFDRLRGRQALNKIKDDILVAGVGFLAKSGDRILPFTATEATGTYDWREQNLKDGVAIFQTSTKKSQIEPQQPDSYMLFSQDKTITHQAGKETIEPNVTGRPMMIALTHKSTTSQPFGRSVLSSPVRDSIMDASRTTRQAMIAAYHYNTKVDIILGVDNETEVETHETQAGDVIKIGTNQDGQIPQVGQFAQHAMAPFNDSILLAARNFCADTKLNLANLGISTNAPESPESLEIVGDDLRDDIEDWQLEIGEQLKYFAVTLWLDENGVSEIDANLQAKIDAIQVAWRPVFRSDISKFGDGINKLAKDAPGVVLQRSTWKRMGLSSHEIDEVINSIRSNL